MEHKDALIKNLTDTIALLGDISLVEEEKFQAAMKNQVFEMEEIIKKEQAFLLRSKGLEQSRARLLQQMGAENLTLRQFIETLPSAERPPFQEKFDALSKAIGDYQKVHHRAKTILEANLHRINKKLEQITGAPLGSGEAEQAQLGAKHLTSRKI